MICEILDLEFIDAEFSHSLPEVGIVLRVEGRIVLDALQ